jgi:tetratricopeptide (TPR) repeat protein
VITVEGVASLSSFASEGERSPVDKFLGYLQWTREGMRQFAFPIVIWVTEHIHNEISRKSQDFYSWRQGVFFFESIQEEPIVPIDVEPIDLQDPESDDLDLPIDELLVYIAQREATGQEDASLTTFYKLLAKAYERDNQIEQAIATWQKAINLQEKLNLSLELIASLNSLGILYFQQGRYAIAEPIFEKGLQLTREMLGDRHPDVATSLNNLAGLYDSQGRYEEAEPLYLEAMQLRRELLGDRHPDVATSLNNLAALYDSQGRYEEAEPLYLEAMQLRRELLGGRHPSVATSLNNLALLYASQGRYKEAGLLYLEAIQLRRELLGNRHPSVAGSLFNLAVLYYKTQHYREALQSIQPAIQIYQQTLGTAHPTTKAALSWLQPIIDQQNEGNHP